jgi:hypothetical protein
MAEQPEVVDPRFDPRFQRGFDPASASASASVAPPPPGSAPAIASAPERAAEPAAIERRSAPGSQGQHTDPDDSDTFDDPDDAPVPAGRNPFRLALLAFGIALPLVSIALLLATQDIRKEFLTTSSAGSPELWTMQALLGIIPTATMTAGVLALGAWIALGALDSVRRPGSATRVR